MIKREVININGQNIYKNYSDKGVYIRNKKTGLLYTNVNSSIDYEYEETDIPIETEEPTVEELKAEIEKLKKEKNKNNHD